MSKADAKTIRDYAKALKDNKSAENWMLEDFLFDLEDWASELEKSEKALPDRKRVRLEKKLTEAELRLADAKAWLSTWRFGMSPSEIHMREEKIKKLHAARDAIKEKLA